MSNPERNVGAENTDYEICNFPGWSVHVTGDERGLGINVGGHVIVKTAAMWHALATRAAREAEGERGEDVCPDCDGSGWHTEYDANGVPCGDSPCGTCGSERTPEESQALKDMHACDSGPPMAERIVSGYGCEELAAALKQHPIVQMVTAVPEGMVRRGYRMTKNGREPQYSPKPAQARAADEFDGWEENTRGNREAERSAYAPRAAEELPSGAVVAIQEAWEAAGGNPNIKPTKAELLENLRLLDEVCDDADADTAPVHAQAVPFAKLLREVVAYVPKGAMYDCALTVHQVVEAALAAPPEELPGKTQAEIAEQVVDLVSPLLSAGALEAPDWAIKVAHTAMYWNDPDARLAASLPGATAAAVWPGSMDGLRPFSTSVLFEELGRRGMLKAPPPSAGVVTDEQLNAAIDAYNANRARVMGQQGSWMRAALEAALAAAPKQED